MNIPADIIDRIYFHCNNSFQQTLKHTFLVKIMVKNSDLAQKAQEILKKCLNSVPFLETELLNGQNGDLVVMAEHNHLKTTYNVLTGKLPNSFPAEFHWKDYKTLCRDWEWLDFEDD